MRIRYSRLGKEAFVGYFYVLAPRGKVHILRPSEIKTVCGYLFITGWQYTSRTEPLCKLCELRYDA